jgi:predicted RNA-binding Zn ribbon-like protein
MEIAYHSPEGLKLLGGRLCLDFVNTVDGRTSDERREDYLPGYAELVRWSVRAGALTAAQAARLLERAARRSGEVEAAHERALALREALYRVALAAVERAAPAADDLALLNAAVAEAMARARLRPSAGGTLAWEWDEADDAPDRMLWPIARSAAELLTDPGELARVRQCPGANCGWLFLDETKNRSRRWCDMEVCGNRAKARRHYARARVSRD